MKIVPGIKSVLLKTIAGSVYLNGEEEQAQEQIDKRAWSYEWMLYSDTQCFYHSDCDEWDLCKAFNPLADLSFIDWPRSGSVRVRTLFSRTRTLTTRFSPEDWRT